MFNYNKGLYFIVCFLLIDISSAIKQLDVSLKYNQKHQSLPMREMSTKDVDNNDIPKRTAIRSMQAYSFQPPTESIVGLDKSSEESINGKEKIINKNNPMFKSDFMIDLNDDEVRSVHLTAQGMPCTSKIIEAFGLGFDKFISDYKDYVEKIDNQSMYKMLVYADMAARIDKKSKKSSLYSSSFGTRFWKPINKIAGLMNDGGVIATEITAIAALILNETNNPENKSEDLAKDSEVLVSNSKLTDVLDALKASKIGPYLGFCAAMIYNLSDNISNKVYLYSLDKYSYYLLLDEIQDYLLLTKSFVKDGGNVDELKDEFKYGDVDSVNITKEFFNENGPLYTKGIRTIFNSSEYKNMSGQEKSILQKESRQENILKSTYRKMSACSWLSAIFHPLSGFSTLIASCSLTVSLGTDNDDIKWWSQCISTTAIPLSFIFSKFANYFDKLSTQSARNYMLYSYYHYTNQPELEKKEPNT